MKNTLIILFKLFTFKFYRKYYYIILLWFILSFGIVNPPLLFYSDSFLAIVVTSIYLFGGVIIITSLFYKICLNFLLKELSSNELQFLMTIHILPKFKINFAFSIVLSSIFLPALIYFVLIVRKSIIDKEIFTLLITFLIFAIYYILLCYLVNSKLKTEKKSNFKKLSILRYFAKQTNFHFFYFKILINEYKATFYTINTISFIIVFLICSNLSWKDNSQLIAIYFSLLTIFKAFFIFVVRRKECDYFLFFKILPVGYIYRFSQYLYLSLLLIIVEILEVTVLSYVYNLNITLLFVFIGIYFSNMMLYTSLLYVFRIKMISYVKILFSIFFINIFFILKNDYAIYFISMFIVSFVIFRLSFYDYEHIKDIIY